MTLTLTLNLEEMDLLLFGVWGHPKALVAGSQLRLSFLTGADAPSLLPHAVVLATVESADLLHLLTP